MRIVPCLTRLLPGLLLAGCAGVEQRTSPTTAATLEIREIQAAPAPAAGRTPVIANSIAPADPWRTLCNGFTLQDNSHARIDKAVIYYSRSPRDIEMTLRRGAGLISWIHDQVRARGYPSEIALLPFVESGYDPLAYSHGRAAGLWQFIPSTGKMFGLEQDWWYDGRRDIVASTHAALDYLGQLHDEFNGDWLLALAAYNAGSGNVRRAVRNNRKRGKPTDFWHLKLPKETSLYVPRLLAISKIVNQPGRYDVSLPDLAEQPTFTLVKTGGQLDLAIAAELAGTDTDTLYRLNPGFNRWATHPDGPHRLLVPAGNARQFETNLAELRPDQRTRWTRHKIRQGETLTHIARRYDTTVDVLKTINQLSGTRIRSGQHLLIPVAARNADRYQALQKLATGGKQSSYTVRNGDSLWTIARRYKVTVKQLIRWNRLDNGSTIRPGQQLAIRTGGNARTRSIRYTVRSGDSLYAISKKFNVSIADLKRWNRLDGKKYLQPGQKLKLHVDVTRVSQG